MGIEEKIERSVQYARDFPDIDVEALSDTIRIGNLITQTYTDWGRFVEKHGLSASRYRVMVELFHSPGQSMTPAELADEVGLSRAAMTSSLDGLEKRRYIRRTRHHSDRRRISVQLTPSGVRFMEASLPEHYRLFARIIECLTKAERRRMIHLGKKLSDSVRAVLEEAK